MVISAPGFKPSVVTNLAPTIFNTLTILSSTRSSWRCASEVSRGSTSRSGVHGSASIRIPASSGGRAPSSTRSTPGASRTRMGTGEGISEVSLSICKAYHVYLRVYLLCIISGWVLPVCYVLLSMLRDPGSVGPHWVPPSRGCEVEPKLPVCIAYYLFRFCLGNHYRLEPHE